MSDKNIFENISARRFYLNEIVANTIKEDQSRKDTILHKKLIMIFKKYKGSSFIKVTTETFVDPEDLFYIKLEHIADFKLKKEISNKEVETNINELISPLGEEEVILLHQ